MASLPLRAEPGAYHAPLSALIPIPPSTRGASLHGTSEPHIATAVTSQFPQTRQEAHWEATTVPPESFMTWSYMSPQPLHRVRRVLTFHPSLCATVTERCPRHVARELFGDSQAEDMDVGSEIDMQRATPHRSDLQTDLTAKMRAPIGPQGTINNRRSRSSYRIDRNG